MASSSSSGLTVPHQDWRTRTSAPERFSSANLRLPARLHRAIVIGWLPDPVISMPPPRLFSIALSEMSHPLPSLSLGLPAQDARTRHRPPPASRAWLAVTRL